MINSDLVQGRIAKIKNIFRVDEVIVKELPIYGKLYTYMTYHFNTDISSAKHIVVDQWPVYGLSIYKGKSHAKTHYTQTSVEDKYNEVVRAYHCVYRNPSWGGGEYGDRLHDTYNNRDWYGFFNFKGFYYHGEWQEPPPEGEGNWCKAEGYAWAGYGVSDDDKVELYVVKSQHYEIDWKKTLEPLYNPDSSDYVNPDQYTIVNWQLGDTDWNSENLAIMDPSMKYESSNGIIITDLSTYLNKAYHDKGRNEHKQVFNAKHIAFKYNWMKIYDAANDKYTTKFNLISVEPIHPKAVKAGDNCYYVEFPATIKVFLIPTSYVSKDYWSSGWKKKKKVSTSNEEERKKPPDEPPEGDEDKTETGDNAKVTTSKGSISSGLNKTHTHYEDLVTSFDSIYLTSDDYNSLVSSGGGIISESGIYPNGEALYIESIKLSITGSTMTVVQVAKFDSTLKLSVGEKVYGYIINQDGDYQPSFAGYVYSISRRLGPNGQEIVYQCRDLKHYFTQLYTPVVYKSTDHDIKFIANDILIRAGITNFYNNLPSGVKVKVNWQAEPLSMVLDYLCSVAGEYYYWIDKNGYLHIDKLNGTVHSFRIPSEGESIGDHKVLSFNTMQDLSFSRSKIVVVGGSGYEIHEKVATFESISPYESKTLLSTFHSANSFSDMEGKNGWVLVRAPEGGSKYSYEVYDVYLVVSVSENSEMLKTLRNGESPYVTYVLYDGANLGYKQGEESRDYSARLMYISNRTIVLGKWRVSYNQFKGRWEGDIVTNMYAKKKYKVYYAFKDATKPLVVHIDTGHPGGTYTFHMPEAQKIEGQEQKVDDTSIMKIIASKLAEYYKPIYGGTLVLDGLHIDINLGDLISITNTNLPSSESSNLKVYEITYNIPEKTTTIQLSTLPNITGITVDPDIIRANLNYYRQYLERHTYRIVRENLTF